MFEPRPFSDKSTAQDNLIVALKSRDLIAFDEALADPDVDPDYWYGKPYWSTCLQLAAQTKGCEPFVLALLRAGAGSPRRQRPSAQLPRKLSADALHINGHGGFGDPPHVCVCGGAGGVAGRAGASNGATMDVAALEAASDEPKEQQTVLFWLRDLGRAVRDLSGIMGTEMRALSERMEHVEERLAATERAQQRTNELLRQQHSR